MLVPSTVELGQEYFLPSYYIQMKDFSKTHLALLQFRIITSDYNTLFLRPKRLIPLASQAIDLCSTRARVWRTK